MCSAEKNPGKNAVAAGHYRCPSCGWSPSPQELASASKLTWDHCPNCLCGTHERDADGFVCGGTLQPISIWVRPDDAWEVIQRCSLCGELSFSPMAEDDNPIKLLSLASAPLSSPPFPLERMEEMTALMGGQGDVGGYYGEQGA